MANVYPDELAAKFVGRLYNECKDELSQYRPRVITGDGVITADYVTTRINMSVNAAGIITSFWIG